MKKKIATLLVGVLVAAFVQVGCGGGEQEQDATVADEETATPQN